MKCLLFLILVVSTACAQRSSILDRESDSDRGSRRRTTLAWRDVDRDDTSSTGNRDRGSSGSRDRAPGGQALSSLGVSGRIPENVRVEVEIVRLENPEGLQYNGKKCGWISKTCDTTITAFLDKDRPFSPITTNEMSGWTQVWQKNGITSEDIGKSVTQDVCGGAFNNINLRVRAASSSLTGSAELEYFDCPFRVRLADVAASANEAKFGQRVECRSKYQPNKVRLLVRQRAYEIPESKCQAVAV